MRRFKTALLAAAVTIGVPAMAYAQDRPDDHREHGDRSGGGQRPEGGQRPDGGQRPQGPAPQQQAPAPQQQQQAQQQRPPQGQQQQAQQQQQQRDQARGDRGGDRQDFNRGRPGDRPDFNRGPQGGDRPDFNRGPQGNRPDFNQGGRPDDRRPDFRGDDNRRPDFNGQPGFNRGPGGPGNGGQFRPDDRRGGPPNRAWRQDRSFDWHGYRDQHREVFRAGRYNAPRGWGYGYRRFSIGIRIPNFFFGEQYWINDPWQYRLPPAYGPYRWIRYYNDVLLIDVRTGEVIDEVPDFFW